MWTFIDAEGERAGKKCFIKILALRGVQIERWLLERNGAEEVLVIIIIKWFAKGFFPLFSPQFLLRQWSANKPGESFQFIKFMHH